MVGVVFLCVEYNLEVDENDVVIGLRLRVDFYTGKYIPRSVHLILKNSKNQILLQMRSKDKVWVPNKLSYSVWDCSKRIL